MFDWIGISHLFELSTTEAIAGFFTPLAIFVVFLLLQLILPGRRVPGYAINPETGEPRNYKLNGIIVFAIAIVAWWFIDEVGVSRDWFYRSTIPAVIGGTFWAALISLWAFYSQPEGHVKNAFLAFWHGRSLELTLFNDRFDIKMYLYVVGGTMWVLNALSGAVFHYRLFGDESNPGVFLYAGFMTFYVFDYFIFERVQLYTYDLIHENLGFKLIWGALVIYGWLYILPMWGMAALPDPGFAEPWNYILLIGTALLFIFGWTISRGGNLQKYMFKRFPDRKFLGIIEQRYIEAGDRKILYSGLWGYARHFNYLGEGFASFAVALMFGYFTNIWAFTYFIFITSLFTWRQVEDDKVCLEKYGAEKWAEYKEKVPYRIFPGIY